MQILGKMLYLAHTKLWKWKIKWYGEGKLNNIKLKLSNALTIRNAKYRTKYKESIILTKISLWWSLLRTGINWIISHSLSMKVKEEIKILKIAIKVTMKIA